MSSLRRVINIILSQRSLHIILFSIGIALLKPPMLQHWQVIIHLVYSYYIYIVISSRSTEDPGGRTVPKVDRTKSVHPFVRYLLYTSLALVLITRILPFVRFGGSPLGYDTGFYRQYISSANYISYTNGAGYVPAYPLAITLHWNPLHLLAGIPADTLLPAEYILLQLLLVIALYGTARAIAPREYSIGAATSTVFLFSVSVVQFFGYWGMYFKQQLGMVFFFTTLALFLRASPLAFFTMIMGAAIHPATFFPLGVAFVAFLMMRLAQSFRSRRRPSNDVLLMLAAGTLGLLIFFERIYYQIRSFNLSGWLYTSLEAAKIPEATGLFISSDLFRLAIIALVPFSIYGIITMILPFSQKQVEEPGSTRYHDILLWLIATLALLTWFPFMHQQRFFMHYDLMLILLAAVPFWQFIRALQKDSAGATLVGGLCLALIVNIVHVTWLQQPQVYADELADIKKIPQIAEPNAYAMTIDSLYTPWVYSYTNSMPSIVPGYLYWDRWNLAQWHEFWKGQSNARRHELLHRYEAPLYIFIGRKINPDLAAVRFIRSDSHFRQVLGSVWRYDPAGISSSEIKMMKDGEQEHQKTPASKPTSPIH